MTSNTNNETLTANTTYFFNNHLPALEDGSYEIEAQQVVSISNETQSSGALNSSSVSPTIETQSASFTVAGPRFQISSSLIHSVFPPIGAKGDFRATLPKMTFTRSTLPWERNAILNQNTETDAPWLFLLLVSQDEAGTTVAEKNGVSMSTWASYFASGNPENNQPSIPPEDLDLYPNKLNYLEIDPSLSVLFPATATELTKLSYARIKTGATATETEEEMAVLLGNRLPMGGENSTVYLVSLENCYPTSTGAFAGPKDGDNYIVPYFFKWQFHAHDDKLYYVDQTIEDNINNTLKAKNGSVASVHLKPVRDTLYQDTSTFLAALGDIGSPPAPAASLNTAQKQAALAANKVEKAYVQGLIEKMALLPETSFHSLLTHLPGGFAPLALPPTPAQKLIEKTGSISMPFLQMKRNAQGVEERNGTVAWYRSPLAATSINLQSVLPGFPLVGGNLPVNSAQYVFTDPTTGQLDVTYAAAFELGKLIALDDVAFSTQFFQWKNELSAATRMAHLQQKSTYPKTGHLPFTPPSTNISLPQQLQDKITSWQNLENIPYVYIIPDHELLPTEGIRFFQLDNNWINAFLCGAFSVGHVAADLSSSLSTYLMSDTVTGFFMNSMVISGWPDFITKAYPQSGTSSLSLKRRDDIDVNLRMYLVSGNFDELEFYLHPMKAHSGFVWQDAVTKKTTNKTTGKTTTKIVTPAGCFKEGKAVPLVPVKKGVTKSKMGRNVVDIGTLYTNLGAKSIAQFAGMMLAETPTVVYKIDPVSTS